MTARTVVGYQILGADGFNIHGDQDDPFKLNSYDVLVGPAVETARAWREANSGYRVAPVNDGDVEEPAYVDKVEIVKRGKSPSPA